METSLTTIPRMRRVHRDTYANLPTTGLKIEDLGYATDRKIFYRWSGIAWEPLTIYIGYGLAVDKPAAAGLPDGCLYQETDTTKLMEAQAGVWVCIFYTGYGLAADKPAAAGLPDGSQYQEQDTHKLMQVQVAAWVCIFFSGSGLAANIPDPADMPEGALYFETDTAFVKQVQSAAWVEIASAAVILEVQVSEVLRNSNTAEKNTISEEYVKLKEVLLNADLPACTLKYDAKNPAQNGGNTQLYKNGVALSASHKTSFTSDTWMTLPEDFLGFVSGDLIQIYAKTLNPANTTRVRNMKFYYSKFITHIGMHGLVTDLETTTDPTIPMTNQDP
ncbi:hypothetical protein ES708_32825 [subsurface metagenome]